MKTYDIELEDAFVPCIEFGCGDRPLVLIPGLSLHMLTPLAQAIEQQYAPFCEEHCVLLLDRPANLGQQSDETAFGSIQHMADQVSRAIRNVNIAAADVMGFSQGGMIAQLLAIEHPEQVKSLILCSTAAAGEFGFEAFNAWQQLAELDNPVALNRSFAASVYSPAFVEANRQAFANTESLGTPSEMKRLQLQVQAMMQFDSRGELGNISAPTLVVHGGNDNVFGSEAGRLLAQEIGCTLHFYPAAPHALYDELPDFLQVAKSFFDAH